MVPHNLRWLKVKYDTEAQSHSELESTIYLHAMIYAQVCSKIKLMTDINTANCNFQANTVPYEILD